MYRKICTKFVKFKYKIPREDKVTIVKPMINNTTQLNIRCKLLEDMKLLLTLSRFLLDAVDTLKKIFRFPVRQVSYP
jgi:hypothetical protein